MQRRSFFKKSTAAGLGLLGTSSLPGTKEPCLGEFNDYKPVKPELMVSNGAIYIPAKAFNTWQQLKNDPSWQDDPHQDWDACVMA